MTVEQAQIEPKRLKNAIDKAMRYHRLDGVKPLMPAFWIYEVQSPASGETHYIECSDQPTTDNANFACTCKAGQEDMLCWHVALVMLYAKLVKPGQ